MGRKIIYRDFKDITDEYILQKFWPNKHSTFLRQNNHGHVSEDELKYLNERFEDSTGPEETIYRLKHNIFERPKCPICGADLEYRKYGGFKKYCSQACINKREGFKEQREKTCLERYGTHSVLTLDRVREKSIELAHTEEAKEKRKQTCLKRYGVKYPVNTKEAIEKAKIASNTPEVKDKIRKTCLEKYGVSTPIIRKETLEKAAKNSHTPEANQKRKETMTERYGVEYSMQIPEILEKCQATNNTPEAKLKREQTNLERYGYRYNFQDPENKKKAKEASKSPEAIAKRTQTNIERFGADNYGNRTKARQTWLEKYGVPHPSMREESKDHMRKIMESPEMQNRRYNTMKRNHSFKFSKQEEESYNILLTKFSDVKRQYKDKERYPFNCDFYIPSRDLFIECQYFWTHNNHPFDKNNIDDINKAETLLEKNHINAFETWTIRDVKKREIAKENNLNWIEFFNIKEFKKWFEDL